MRSPSLKKICYLLQKSFIMARSPPSLDNFELSFVCPEKKLTPVDSRFTL